jgi:hypothetical protein
MKAFEVEVHFIGEPEYYYFSSRKEAEKAAEELNNLPAEAACFGDIKTVATINEIELKSNQYIEGNEIITSNRR